MKYLKYKSFYTDNLLLQEQKHTKLHRSSVKKSSARPGWAGHWCATLACPQWWVVLLSVAAILAGGGFLAFDSCVRWILLNKAVLRADTATYRAWKSPPISPSLKVFLFNLTNPAAVFEGTEKPRVVEVGPYTYRQKWDKQNITWGHNGTVTYKSRKTFTFSPTESCLGCSDTQDEITTLNIVLLAAYHKKKKDPFSLKLAISSLSSFPFCWNDCYEETPWMTKSPAEILWGYDDQLYSASKLNIFDKNPPFDQFGIFVEKKTLEEKLLPNMTMLTGETDSLSVGQIKSMDGKSHLEYWNSDSCNQIHGTSGASFGPFKNKDDTIYLFDKQMCRSIPFSFSHSVTHQGLNGLRFQPREDVFMSRSFPRENSCYNGSDREFGDGVYDISPCQYDAPIVLSWPHFLHAEDKYQAGVDNLSPDHTRHQTFFDVEPVSGSTMRAKARIQVNMAVRQTEAFANLQKVNDTLIPILWFEEGIDGLSDELLKMLYGVTVEIELLKKILFGTLICLCCIDSILILHGLVKFINQKMATARLKTMLTNLWLVVPGHPASLEPRLLSYSNSQGTSLSSSAEASKCHSRTPSHADPNQFINQIL